MAEKRAWKSGLASFRRQHGDGLGLQMEIDRIAQRLGAAILGDVEMDDLPQGMDAGIGAARRDARLAARRRRRRPHLRWPAGPRGHCPGAASRRRGRRHIRPAGGSGSCQRRAGRKAEAALEILGRQGRLAGALQLQQAQAPPRRRRSSAGRRSDGPAWPRPSTASASRTFTRSPAISHQAPGRGARARTRRSSSAGRLAANRAAPPRG